jgi:8-oxo-dGTP diphosphatase
MTDIIATNNQGYAVPGAFAADADVRSIVDQRLCVLLVWRVEEPFLGQPSLAGGFVGDTESSAETVQRKLTEKTGMPPVYMEQLHHYDSPDRDPRGRIPTTAYLGLVKASLLPDDSDAKRVPVDEVPALAFDHNEIVNLGTNRLMRKMWESNIALGLLPERFALSDARKVFEVVLGRTYDVKNFGRDLKATGLIRPTGELRREGPGKPAELYEWVSRDPEWRPRLRTLAARGE